VICSFEDVRQTALAIAAETSEVCIVFELDDSWGLGANSYMLRTMERFVEAGTPEGARELGRAGHCNIKGAFWSVLH